MRKIALLICIFALLLLSLGGCATNVIEALFQLPLRQDSLNSLQSAINASMKELSYCAPAQGENQQLVQMADLNGDGLQEYVVFARDDSSNQLQILVFASTDGIYSHIQTFYCAGNQFDQVIYAPLDNAAGDEILIGTKLNSESLGQVYVFSPAQQMKQPLLQAAYHRFLALDMDSDGLSELLLIRPNFYDDASGFAELYNEKDGKMICTDCVEMSFAPQKLSRLLVGKMDGVHNAVLATGIGNDNLHITDILVVFHDRMREASASDMWPAFVSKTSQNGILPQDINYDGVIEFPISEPAQFPTQNRDCEKIRWVSVLDSGETVEKLYSFHNFQQGWYLMLSPDMALQLTMTYHEGMSDFCLEDGTLLLQICVEEASSQSASHGEERFVLYRSDRYMYVGYLLPIAQEYGIEEEMIVRNFALIPRDSAFKP